MSSEIRITAVVPVSGNAFAVGAQLGKLQEAADEFRRALGEGATFEVNVVKLKPRKVSVEAAAQVAQAELPTVAEPAHGEPDVAEALVDVTVWDEPAPAGTVAAVEPQEQTPAARTLPPWRKIAPVGEA